MKTFLFTSIACGLAVGMLHAEDAPKPDAPKPEAYQLKRRSEFSGTEKVRAPFWPIGWVKRQKGSIVEEQHKVDVPKVTLDASMFKLTSIMLGPPSLAVINGRPYAEGEFLRSPRTAAQPGSAAQPGTQSAFPQLAPGVRIRVQRITDGQVVLQLQDQLITISIPHSEIAAKKPDQELNLEDR